MKKDAGAIINGAAFGEVVDDPFRALFGGPLAAQWGLAGSMHGFLALLAQRLRIERIEVDRRQVQRRKAALYG